MQRTPGFLGVQYFEIPVEDLDRAVSFYEEAFNIPLTRESVDGYEMALFPETAQGRGATGALAKGDVYVPAKTGAILYLSVPSIKRSLDRLTRLGAEVLLDPREVPGQGIVAEFEDSEGNRIALFQPTDASSASLHTSP
ncbi:MAG: VOC family protein [Pseudomonadota bacterium]